MATSLKLSSQRLTARILYNYVPACQKHKFKVKNPRPQVMERRVFEHVIQPMYPQELSVLKNSCLDANSPRNQVEEPDPYEEFLIRQLTKLVAESEMIIICQKLRHTHLRKHLIKVALGQKNMKLITLNTKHLRQVFENTEKENLNYLLHGHCMMVTSPEPNIKEMWTVMKKVPELIVLGGFCKDRLITRDQILAASKLPPMEQLLGELVACLNLAAGARTSSLLGSHQQTLSRNLEQYQKQLSDKSS